MNKKEMIERKIDLEQYLLFFVLVVMGLILFLLGGDNPSIHLLKSLWGG